jgi:hypothetical protein
MYELIWEPPNGLIRRYWGKEVSGSEVEQSAIKGQSDPRYSELSYSIADFTECDQRVGTTEQLEEIAATSAVASLCRRASSRSALVGTNSAVVEVLRKYAAMSFHRHHPAQVFTSIAEARRWVSER